jgi:hypothetical protein
MLDRAVSTNKMIKNVQGFQAVEVIPIKIRMQGDKNMKHYFLTVHCKKSILSVNTVAWFEEPDMCNFLIMKYPISGNS